MVISNSSAEYPTNRLAKKGEQNLQTVHSKMELTAIKR